MKKRSIRERKAEMKKRYYESLKNIGILDSNEETEENLNNDYELKTKAELIEIAESLGLKVNLMMKKADLIKLIEEA